MKLNKLISLNENAKSDLSLVQSFGDAFLCQNNSVFKIVRAQVLKAGFSFSAERNLFYETLPLSQLDRVLETRVLPYVDNVSVLKSLGVEADWSEVSDNFKANHVLHESCHAVARAVTLRVGGEHKLVNALIEESFANTCELLALSEAAEPAHRIFLEANSYCTVFEQRTNLKKALDDYGPSAVVKFFILAYLFSNFLYDKISEQDYGRMLKLCGLSQSKSLRALAKICFELNPEFRYVTTGFYFRMNKLEMPKNLNQTQFLAIFESDKKYGDILQGLAELF